MRPRKQKPMRIYEYRLPDQVDSTWTEILVSSSSDEEDAAIDASEAWCAANPEAFYLFEKGQYVTVRLKGDAEEHTFEILMQSIPEFIAESILNRSALLPLDPNSVN